MRKASSDVFVLILISIAAALWTAAGHASNDAASKDAQSGKQLYTTYCSLCHGSDGKGGGPFSPQLKTWPPDLTQLAKKNHGVFPEMRVTEAIDGEFGKPSHGPSEMPIWGPVFRSMAHGHKDNAQLRIGNLVKYLESIQEK